MSLAQINLCSFIVKEHLGEVSQKIMSYLMKKGFTPLKLLAEEIGLQTDKVFHYRPTSS